jgi:3-polyprenyl-4-hydroxybenzoate decarboxylase
MAWTKMIVVVDEDVDVHDEQAVWAALLSRCDLRRDVELVHGPLDILDHAAPFLGAGGKIGFDATRKRAGESIAGVPFDRELDSAELAAMPADLGRLGVAAAACPFAAAIRGRGGHAGHGSSPATPTGEALRWPNRLVALAIDDASKQRDADAGVHAIERFWAEAPPGLGDFAIAVDATVRLDDPWDVLFHWVSNADPSRDRVVEPDLDAPAGSIGPRRLGFDATSKVAGRLRKGMPIRDYPPMVSARDAVSPPLAQRPSPETGASP